MKELSVSAKQKYSWIPTSFVDSPDGCCAVIFSDRCCLHCDYCYQKDLFGNGQFTIEEMIEQLDQKLLFENGHAKVDWLILSGGEFLCDDAATKKILTWAKEHNLKRGLYTSGVYDAQFNAVAKDLNWVNLDFKYLPEDLQQYCKMDYKLFWHSTNVLLHMYEIPYRLMTVMRRSVHTVEYMKKMAQVMLDETYSSDWHVRSFKRMDGTLGNLKKSEELSNEEIIEIINAVNIAPHVKLTIEG
jgi:pyruvate-formate lyase-activating enzyme